MNRRIAAFFQDEAGDWAARLDCGHAQHTRHQPPFVNRPWVESADGRNEHLGQWLDCLKCNRLELPEGLSPYRRTPDFDQDNVPAGLQREHRTKAGVWGKIHVTDGRLRYVSLAPAAFTGVLSRGTAGIVAPDHPHYVAIVGPVRFFVEFLRPTSDEA